MLTMEEISQEVTRMQAERDRQDIELRRKYLGNIKKVITKEEISQEVTRMQAERDRQDIELRRKYL